MPTIAQLALIRGNQYASQMYDTVIASTPLLAALDTRELLGMTYLSLARTGLPTAGGFKDLNEGATSGQVSFKMGRVEAKRLYMVVSEPVSSTDLWNREHTLPGGAMVATDWLTLQAQGRLESENINLEKSIIEGTVQDSKSFPGFKQLTSTALASNTLALTDTAAASLFVKEVLNAGGATNNVNSSVYSISEGERGVHLRAGGLQGMAGFLTMSEIARQYAADPADSTKEQEYYKQNGEGYVGLSVCGADAVSADRTYVQRALRRLCNLTPLVPLTEAMLDKLISSHGPGNYPTKFAMSYRSGEQLQASRSPGSVVYFMGAGNAANNQMTQRAPFPENHRGVPIIYSPWISDTDVTETPA